MPISTKPPTTKPTQYWSIPEIINGTWSKKLIRVHVPSNCSKCSQMRSDTYFVNNQQYGHLTRAVCIHGCPETYEDIRLQAEVYKSAGKVVSQVVSNPSFFKGILPEWKPDTRTGTIPVSAKAGMTCANKFCNAYCGMAEPNQPDGKTFICYSCRTQRR